MNCEQFRAMLDAYMDGELTDAEVCAMQAHADACEACGEEWNATRLLQDVIGDMDDEVVVPLEAQAAWRNAVRAEAKKRNVRKWMRVAYAAAAALVLVFGANFMMEKTADKIPNQQLMLAAAGDIIARDGSASGAGESPSEYSVWKKISVQDTKQAAQALEMLAAEYNGSFMEDDGDICRIELPMEYLEDFLKAAERIGTELYVQTADAQTDPAIVLIQFADS